MTEAPPTVTVIHGPEWTLRLSERSHWCDWELFERMCLDPDPPEWLRKGWQSSDDTTTDLDAAEPEIKGHVKWDGCSEFEGGTHGCSPSDLRATLDAIAWAASEAWRLIWRHSSQHLEPDTTLPDGKPIDGGEPT